MKLTKLINQRKLKGFSQTVISERMHLTQSQYCRREKGLIQITCREWNQLAAILEVNVNEIYENKNVFEDENGYLINSIAVLNTQKLIKKIDFLEKENQILRTSLKRP